MLSKNITLFQVVFFENVPKTQNLRILRGKMIQNVIFLCAKFFSKSAV